ncbi:MAG: ABC transporter permease [Planctomycetota bacterium]
MTDSIAGELATPSTSSSALVLRDCRLVAGSRTLLDGTTVHFPRGKISVLIGRSGAGKSVLLRFIAGLIDHRDPDITAVGGLSDGSEREPRIGIVFQQFALFDELSPLANVQFAIDHRGPDDAGVITPDKTAIGWLEQLGVPVETAVAVLSGGQKQRLAIARTLASEPDIVLYDEPTSGLDAATGRQVASLIRQTQSSFGRTSIVVTHDYETMIPIADEVFVLDSDARNIRSVPRSQWSGIADLMQSVATASMSGAVGEETTRTRGQRLRGLCFDAVDEFLRRTGESVYLAGRFWLDLVTPIPNMGWATRFCLRYLRLVGGISAWLYLLIAGLIAGFTTTYFTLRFLPFRLYTQPLLMDDLLSSIGFALYRVLVPVLSTILIAARCGAAVAADVGVKRYGGQVDALETLGIRRPAYLLIPIVVAFLVATPILESFAFRAAAAVSRLTFVLQHPEIGAAFWRQHFYRVLTPATSDVWIGRWGPYQGFGFVMCKSLVCGLGTAVISYYQGIARKLSASDISDSITATVLWSTLFVLVVHFAIALVEF